MGYYEISFPQDTFPRDSIIKDFGYGSFPQPFMKNTSNMQKGSALNSNKNSLPVMNLSVLSTLMKKLQPNTGSKYDSVERSTSSKGSEISNANRDLGYIHKLTNVIGVMEMQFKSFMMFCMKIPKFNELHIRDRSLLYRESS